MVLFNALGNFQKKGFVPKSQHMRTHKHTNSTSIIFFYIWLIFVGTYLQLGPLINMD